MLLEVAILAWALLLTVVYFAVMAVFVNADVGPRWTGGPRDEPREFGVMAGRMKRAFANQLEAMVMFTPAVLVVALANSSTGFTQAMAVVFLVARIAYLPAYAVPIWGLRSAVWGLGFLATIALPVAVLLSASVA